MLRKLTLLFILFFLSFQGYSETAREYFKFAKFSFDSHDYQKALEFINRAIEVDPEYVNGFLLRAEIYFKLGEFSEVIDDITQAFNKDENANKTMAEFHLLRGNAYLMIKDYIKALYDVDFSLKLNPANSRAHIVKAMVEMERIKYFEALECFDKAINLDADNSDYYYQRAELKKTYFKPLAGTKNYESIMTDIRMAIVLDSGDYRPYRLRCEMLKIDGNFRKEALIAELDGYIRQFPDKAVFYSERGLANVLTNKYNSAIDDFTRAIELDEGNEANYRNRALCLHNMGKYSLAASDYTNSIDILVKKFQESGQSESVKKVLAQTLNMRGMTLRLNGNAAQACDDYYNAAKLGSKAGLNNYRRNCNVYN